MNAINLAQLRDTIQRRGAPAAVVQSALPAMRLLAIAGVKEHFATSTGPGGESWKALAHPRPQGGQHPLRDKGLLMASVGANVTKSQLALIASHPGANVHQHGATIRPKTARMLAIPLTAEANRIGSPRKNHFPRPLFVYAPRGRRSAFLAESKGDGSIRIHYVLKDRVLIPARPFLGFSAKTRDKIDRLLADRLADYVEGLFNPDVSRSIRAVAIH